MNESQFVTILFVFIPEAGSILSLCQASVELGDSSVTVTCWFILAPVVSSDILGDDELLNTCLLIGIC